MAKWAGQGKWATFGILIAVLAAVRGCYELRAVAWLAPYTPVAVAIILIYAPVLLSRWLHDPIDYWNLNGAVWRRSLLWFAGTFLLIIPLFLIGNHFWQQWVFKQTYVPRMIPGLGWLVLDQLFLVALPEEFFFRGWLQSRLNKVYAKRWTFFGVPVGWGWLLTAIIFAISHMLIHYQWWHFSIIFASLLFGWLREKTGSVVAPALWHCFGNIVVYWIGISYVAS